MDYRTKCGKQNEDNMEEYLQDLMVKIFFRQDTRVINYKRNDK